MKEVKYYKKSLKDSDNILAIYQIKDNSGMCNIFGINPESSIIAIEQFNSIEDTKEISKEEYNKLYDIWVSSYTWTVHVNKDEVKTEFIPITKYTVIFNNMMITGYSQSSIEDLNKFLQDIKGGNYLVLNEEGKIVANIGPEVSSIATYAFESLDS